MHPSTMLHNANKIENTQFSDVILISFGMRLLGDEYLLMDAS